MKIEQSKNEFIQSLLGIYNLDIIRVLLQFLQGEQAVLFALSVKKKSSPTILSQKLNLTKSRMSMILNSLSKKELIELTKDMEDKRKTNVTLTEKGLNEIKEKEEVVLNLFSILYNKLGEEKVIVLTDIINEIVEHMKEVEAI